MNNETTQNLNEPVLADDYPVYMSYAYVVDGRPISSPIEGDISQLKRELGAGEIRRCDLGGRGLL